MVEIARKSSPRRSLRGMVHYNIHLIFSIFSQIFRNSFREKLRYLRQLDYDLISSHLPEEGALDDVPLLYLSSMLYINFSMLWPETLKLIESHGTSMNRDRLWKCLNGILIKAADNCIGMPVQLSWKDFSVKLYCFNMSQEILVHVDEIACTGNLLPVHAHFTAYLTTIIAFNIHK